MTKRTPKLREKIVVCDTATPPVGTNEQTTLKLRIRSSHPNVVLRAEDLTNPLGKPIPHRF